MSYCRFGNTANALTDCVEVMLGEDEYDKCLADLGATEKRGYEDLKELCESFLDAVAEFEERESEQDEDEDEDED